MKKPWKRKRSSSSPDALTKRAEDAHRSQAPFELEYDEVTGLIEGVTEKLRQDAARAQELFAKTTKKLEDTLRRPAPGPSEKLG